MAYEALSMHRVTIDVSSIVTRSKTLLNLLNLRRNFFYLPKAGNVIFHFEGSLSGFFVEKILLPRDS